MSPISGYGLCVCPGVEAVCCRFCPERDWSELRHLAACTASAQVRMCTRNAQVSLSRLTYTATTLARLHPGKPSGITVPRWRRTQMAPAAEPDTPPPCWSRNLGCWRFRSFTPSILTPTGSTSAYCYRTSWLSQMRWTLNLHRRWQAIPPV
jgi:hypothetical protein